MRSFARNLPLPFLLCLRTQGFYYTLRSIKYVYDPALLGETKRSALVVRPLRLGRYRWCMRGGKKCSMPDPEYASGLVITTYRRFAWKLKFVLQFLAQRTDLIPDFLLFFGTQQTTSGSLSTTFIDTSS